MNQTHARFGDVVELLPGHYLSKDKYSAAGGPYVVYGSNSIMGTHEKYLYEGPIIVMARIGSNCGAVMWSQEAAWVNNNASAIRVRSGADARYIYYWLRIQDLTAHRRGSGQPFISHESLGDARISFPSRAQQRAIAEVLGALDDKIDANERLVHACDELWFALATHGGLFRTLVGRILER